jgi:outer membrane protein OmpA-like peptidoglycan-associated protein
MKRRAEIFALIGAATLLSGCSHDLIVVLPESEGGHVGGVVVDTGKNSQVVLDKPYEKATPGALLGSGKSQSDEKEVNEEFSSALAARPIPPQSYTLYFVSDSDQLTPESKSQFEAVFAEISRRKAAEIVVTGHTDTVGGLEYNDNLSLERAKSVEKLFAARGLSPDSMTAVGRGKRELLVQTPDNTQEPRNRRVVITVR